MGKYCTHCGKEVETHYKVLVALYSEKASNSMDEFEVSKNVTGNVCKECAKEMYAKI